MTSGPAAIARLPDWEARLADYFAAAAEAAHCYGAHDCLLHCAAAVAAQTGVDLGAAHRGKYRNKAGSRRYLASLGFTEPAELVTSLLPLRDPAFARRGDIVMEEDGVPGVCMGEGAAFVTEEGLRAGYGAWAKAWSVG